MKFYTIAALSLFLLATESYASPFGEPQTIESLNKNPAATIQLFKVTGVQAGSAKPCELRVVISDQQNNVDRNGEKYRGMNVHLSLEVKDSNLGYNRVEVMSYERLLFPLTQGSGSVDLGNNRLRQQYARSRVNGNTLVSESAYVPYSHPRTLVEENMTVEFSKDLSRVLKVTAFAKSVRVLQSETVLTSLACEF